MFLLLFSQAQKWIMIHGSFLNKIYGYQVCGFILISFIVWKKLYIKQDSIHRVEKTGENDGNNRKNRIYCI